MELRRLEEDIRSFLTPDYPNIEVRAEAWPEYPRARADNIEPYDPHAGT